MYDGVRKKDRGTAGEGGGGRRGKREMEETTLLN